MSDSRDLIPGQIMNISSNFRSKDALNSLHTLLNANNLESCKELINTGNVTEAAFTLIIYFVMRNVLRAHLRSLFVRKRRTMTKITCVHGHQKNTVKKKTSVKKMATKS